MTTHINLLLRSIKPENQEFPIIALSDWITPHYLFYRRNHFSYPVIHLSKWNLTIDGHVKNPIQLTYSTLKKLPQVTLSATLECAGNKRGLFNPKARGEQWEFGAMGHALWTGIPLRDLLEWTRFKPDAVEVMFEGMDFGERTDLPGLFFYARSLPLHQAVHPDTLLALYMNGRPLSYRHGFPLRLIVPGWYGMASVKWLRKIVLLDRPFQGPFQTRDYVLIQKPNQYENAIPVTTMNVNSTIAFPSDQSSLRSGQHMIYGVAWSGISPVSFVELSDDEGHSWIPAAWVDPQIPYSWRRWTYCWNVKQPGIYTLKVRATDESGCSQPEKAPWNVKGYANNSMHTITVYID